MTHLTDVQGEGAKFADPEKTILLRFGKGSLVRNGTAQVALALMEPAAYTVYELETSGKRLGTVPAEVRDGRLCFTAAVAARTARACSTKSPADKGPPRRLPIRANCAIIFALKRKECAA